MDKQPTLHSSSCKMVFGRKDPSCPRCQELLAGAKPRDGWQKAYFARKEEADAQFHWQLAHHDCKKANCGPVCTAFDW